MQVPGGSALNLTVRGTLAQIEKVYANLGKLPRVAAGRPMLQVLRGAGLSDAVAVVARWFGGVKLGKGGLARAYSGAVQAALAG